MFKLYTSKQCREIDQSATQDFGLPGSVLMERAGTASFHLIKKQWPKAKRLAVVCGSGNNGGDGFVVARLAHTESFDVVVFTDASANDLKGEALNAFTEMQKTHVRSQPLSFFNPDSFDLIVDSIFGTGLTRAVDEPFSSAIQKINSSSQKPVLALDVPSGLSADTGRVLGIAVKATQTITFIARKQGFYTADGPDHCGEIVFDDLQISPGVFANRIPSAEISLLEERLKNWPARNLNSHKGLFGHVLVIGGDESMGGAVRLAGEAALRTGAGLVTLATHKSHSAFLNLTCPELICHGVNGHQDLRDLLANATTLAIGPGLGQSKWALDLLASALAQNRPMVVDADALNLLSASPQKKSNWILTPHPKEAARLLRCSAEDIQQDRFQAVRELQSRYGGVILLKGHGTLVCDDAQNPIQICPYGSPAMASAGMGDVLTGIIAGLLAQHLNLSEAAILGASLHGRAGEIAGKNAGVALANELGPIVSQLVQRS